MKFTNKDSITLLLLELIQGTAMTTVDILDTLNYYGKSNWYARFRKIQKKPVEHRPLFQDKIAKLRERQRISNLLCKLKSEGLIKSRGGKRLAVTKNGAKRIQLIKGRKINPPKNFIHESSNELKIITFDIPEKQRGKRNWLRDVLKNLKFTKLQQSVWLGKSKLPEEFFEALENLSILPCVEILGVTRTGTLKQLK